MNKVLVKEKGVGEGKGCWGRKRVLGHIWAKPGPDLGQISARSLASPNQPWYARNTIFEKKMTKSMTKFYLRMSILIDVEIIMSSQSTISNL